jgi:hypothetical protein
MLNTRNILILTTSVIAFVLLMWNAVYVWSWGDDYLIKVKFLKQTPLQLISRHCLYAQEPYVATIIASILYFASGIILVIWIRDSFKLTIKEGFVLSMFFVSILWLMGFYSHYETLYWQTGMLYIVEVFLLYLSYLVSHSENTHIALKCLICFIAGIASPGAVLALIFVFLVEIWYTKNTQLKWSVLLTFLGLLVVLLAPGNAMRFKLEGGVDAKAFGNIHELYFRLHQFIDKFFYLNTPMVWIIVLSGVLLLLYNNKHHTKSKLALIYNYRWLIAAFLSILFYLPRLKYYITSPRLNIHFVFFTMMFFVLQLAQFLKENPGAFDQYFSFFYWPVNALFIVIAFYQLWGSAFCYKKMAVRENLYRSYEGQNLILKANDIIGPPATREFIDIDTDSTNFNNESVAQYYKLKSIYKLPYR